MFGEEMAFDFCEIFYLHKLQTFLHKSTPQTEFLLHIEFVLSAFCTFWFEELNKLFVV